MILKYFGYILIEFCHMVFDITTSRHHEKSISLILVLSENVVPCPFRHNAPRGRGIAKKDPCQRQRSILFVFLPKMNYSSTPNALRRKLMKPSKILVRVRYKSSIRGQSIIYLLSMIMLLRLCRRCWDNHRAATCQLLRRCT